MSEPGEPQVSWKAIEAGARVVGSDDEQIGTIEEIVGDIDEDIFSGLAVKADGFDTPRFVDASQVVGIWPDRVTVALPASAVNTLPEHVETPTRDWDPVEEQEGVIESLIGDVTEPGDELEIGRSPVRAFAWALVWGLATTLVFAVLPSVSLAGGIFAGLLAAALVLAMGQVWRPAADAVIGLVLGVAATAYLLLDGVGTVKSIVAGAVILAGAILMGLAMRYVIARRASR
jgi:hypothetical protein